ncbi:MAG: pyridoxal-phosphate dependent enzyme [Bacteroidia bacterium]|nr:pyridoxal-phosphate dependent enzyme [Bacteroidia bacterium]
MLTYQPTPVQEIGDARAISAGVRLLMKREDMNHPLVSGNKWWKLRDNLHAAGQSPSRTVLTFGGAFSNHLYAVAGAAMQNGLASIGVIRGEETLPLNATLAYAKHCGMHLHYVERFSYKQKESPAFIDALRERFGDFYLIPEGGTNALAVGAVRDFARVLNGIDFDVLCVPVGTGGTMAGLVGGLAHGSVIGFSSLKGEGNLEDNIRGWLPAAVATPWQLDRGYHFGGYAKHTPGLLDFITQFKQQHGIPLEQVYTGKMCYGVFDLIEKGFFARGTTILMLHTGGLQGALHSIM